MLLLFKLNISTTNMSDLLKPEYLLSFIAIIVSIFSLVLSVRYNRKTYRLTREHNKKTVEPMLSLLYTLQAPSIDKKPRFQSFQIKNCGFGPAVIKSFSLIVENIGYKHIQTLMDENLKNVNFNYSMSTLQNIENSIIPSNEEVTIFQLFFNYAPLDDDAFTKFYDLAETISLKIDFETIYQEKRIFEVESITGQL
jgi:hypothetical protein